MLFLLHLNSHWVLFAVSYHLLKSWLKGWTTGKELIPCLQKMMQALTENKMAQSAEVTQNTQQFCCQRENVANQKQQETACVLNMSKKSFKIED